MTINISSDSRKENKYIPQISRQNKPQIAFKGMESVGSLVNGAFAQIQTGEIFGPAVADIVSMIIPRYIVDSTRSKDAGRETLIRETSGLAINCIIPGFIAVGVGWLLGKTVNNDIKVNTKLPVDSDTLDMLHHSWKEVNGHKYWEKGEDKKQIIQSHYENVFNKTSGIVGNEWTSLKGKEGVSELAGELADITVRNSQNSKKELKRIQEKFISILGASESVKVKSKDGKSISTTAKLLINSMHDVCQEVHRKIQPDKIDQAMEKMAKTSQKKAIITMGIVTSIGLAMQAINRYITKKRTGSDAFVGLSNDIRNEKDRPKVSKTKLYIEKALSIGAILSIAAASLANEINPKKIFKALKGKELVKKLEYNSMWPRLNQLRVIYAAMIVGRMLAATGEHELRETDTRDIPGFLNWLVIGGFVAKGVGKWLSKGKIINAAKPYVKPDKNASLWTKIKTSAKHFFGNESLMSHVEIDARKMDIKEAKEILTNAGKKIVQKDSEKIIFEAKKVLKGQLNKSIFAGFAYSTLALGVFMPLLNKYITDKLTAKNKNHQPVLQKPENNKPVQQREQSSQAVSAASGVQSSGSSMNKEIFADFINTRQKLNKSVN